MKKIVLFTAALFALGMVAFAKPAKVSGWKDVAKIANKNKLEVVNDETDWYVAKGNGGKDFAFYGVNEFSDATFTFAMSCIGGEVYSRITCVDKQEEAPYPILAMNEDDEKCVLTNGNEIEAHLDDQGTKYWTENLKARRKEFIADIAKEYGLVVPR